MISCVSSDAYAVCGRNAIPKTAASNTTNSDNDASDDASNGEDNDNGNDDDNDNDFADVFFDRFILINPMSCTLMVHPDYVLILLLLLCLLALLR